MSAEPGAVIGSGLRAGPAAMPAQLERHDAHPEPHNGQVPATEAAESRPDAERPFATRPVTSGDRSKNLASDAPSAICAYQRESRHGMKPRDCVRPES